jgi:hypothetical protein
MLKEKTIRRGPKAPASSEVIASFVHQYRGHFSRDDIPRTWDEITVAANKKFGARFLAAHLKRCYAKHRDELVEKSVSRSLRIYRVREKLVGRLAETDKRKEQLRRADQEPNLQIRRDRELRFAAERLAMAEGRVSSAGAESRRQYNKRFTKKKLKQFAK